jgi:lycopene cyclase domain-containing protein
MTYTAAVALAVIAAVALDQLVLRTLLLRRRCFWVAYAIVLFFQLLVNGVLTAQRVVVYSPHDIVGWRVAYAPVEDLLFGFSLIVQTLCWWVWWGRRLGGASATHAPSRATRPTPAAPGRP